MTTRTFTSDELAHEFLSRVDLSGTDAQVRVTRKQASWLYQISPDAQKRITRGSREATGMFQANGTEWTWRLSVSPQNSAGTLTARNCDAIANAARQEEEAEANARQQIEAWKREGLIP